MYQKSNQPTTRNSAELAAQRVKEALPQKRVDFISSYLLERIAQTLRVPAADLDEFAQLGDLGVDSLTSVEIQLWVRSDLEVDGQLNIYSPLLVSVTLLFWLINF